MERSVGSMEPDSGGWALPHSGCRREKGANRPAGGKDLNDQKKPRGPSGREIFSMPIQKSSLVD